MLKAGAILSCVFAAALTPGSPACARDLIIEGGARIVWMEIFASEGDDWINDIVALRDGAFLGVGFLNRVDGTPPSDWRALAVKLQDDGRIIWRREYGAGGGLDAFWSARELDDGNLMMGGFSSRIGPGGINAYFALAAPDGALLKENAYGTAGYDRITSLAPTADGFLGVGHAEGLDGRDLFFVNVDMIGVETSRRAVAGKGANGLLYVEPAPDGNFIVAGGTDEGGDADILVMKVTASGEEIWRRTVGTRGKDDVNHGLVVMPGGRIVVPGYTQSWGAGERDFMAAVLSDDGETISVETIGGAGDDHVILAKPDAQGNVWMIGYTKSAGAGEWDIILAQLDPSGSFRDGVILMGGAADDNGAALRPLADGDLLIGGYSNNLGVGAQDAFIARLTDIAWRPHPAFRTSKVK